MDQNEPIKRWSTDDLPAGTDCLAAWQYLLSGSVIPVEVEYRAAGTFRGEMQVFTYGRLPFLHVSASEQWLHCRTPPAPNDANHWYFVSTMLRGRGWLHAESGTSEINVGDVSFVDACQPFSLEFREEFAYTSVMVPYRQLEDLLPFASAAHGTVVQPPAGAALGAFLIALGQPDEESIQRLSRQAYGISDHLMGLLAGALEPVANSANSRFDRKVVQLSNIKNWSLARLRQENLSVAQAAAAFALSERQLRRLFRSQGTSYSRWVLEARLERCREEFQKVENHSTSIGTLAARWGMTDPAYFTRRFKQRYGCTPGAYRRLHTRDQAG